MFLPLWMMMSLPLQDTFPGSGRTEMGENLVPIVLSYEFSPAFGFSGYKHKEPGYKSINLEESRSGISGIFYSSPQKCPIFILSWSYFILEIYLLVLLWPQKAYVATKYGRKKCPSRKILGPKRNMKDYA